MDFGQVMSLTFNAHGEGIVTLAQGTDMSEADGDEGELVETPRSTALYFSNSCGGRRGRAPARCWAAWHDA